MNDTTQTVLIPRTTMPTRVHCDPPIACDRCGRVVTVVFRLRAYLCALCYVRHVHDTARAIREEGYL